MRIHMRNMERESKRTITVLIHKKETNEFPNHYKCEKKKQSWT